MSTQQNKNSLSEVLAERHQRGQYFTTNGLLRESVFGMVRNKPDVVLEPSVGQGDLVSHFKSMNCEADFHMYEIDAAIKPLAGIHASDIQYEDFLEADIDIRYDTIIGNPPYVKSGTGNLYLAFVEKCYRLLAPRGELVFIVPSDFMKITGSGRIINEMMQSGTFTDVFYPHDESLFADASVDVIVFRFCKDDTLPRKVAVNGLLKCLVNTNGVLTFMDEEPTGMITLSEYFDVFVGIVSGKESVFKNELHGNIGVMNGNGVVDKYIILQEFPTANDELDAYMNAHKAILMSRKIRKFNEGNWFQWGALRNAKAIKDNVGNDCIYVSNLTRSNVVAFRGKVQYFGGSLLMMMPKREIDLQAVVEYINGDGFKSNYMYSGRFKIGHKQLCNGLFRPRGTQN